MYAPPKHTHTHTSTYTHQHEHIPPLPPRTQCMFAHTHTQSPSFLTLLWPMTTALSLLCFLSSSSTTLGSCSGSATFLCELIAITAAADQTVENRSYKAIKCIVETYTCHTCTHANRYHRNKSSYTLVFLFFLSVL